MMSGFGWGMSWGGWIFMIVVLALLVAGVIWLVRGAAGPQDEGRDSARRILDERFASGDISPEEYEARRRALR
jgi:putative membrane protein